MNASDIVGYTNALLGIASTVGGLILAIVFVAIDGRRGFAFGLASGAAVITLLFFGIDLIADVTDIRVQNQFDNGNRQVGELTRLFIAEHYTQLIAALFYSIVTILGAGVPKVE